MRADAVAATLDGMRDGKLEALRSDPLLAVRNEALVALGRIVEMIDLVPGEVLSPADAPPAWGYWCARGRIHVLVGGRPVPLAVGPVLFLPDDLPGTALVAADAVRVVAVPARAMSTVVALAPGLCDVPTYDPRANAEAYSVVPTWIE
jgi:hypothetical protein